MHHELPSRSSGRSGKGFAASLSCSLLAACAGGPQVDTGAQANPSAARGLLAAASTQGPVPLVMGTVPATFAGGPAQVAGTASNAVAWLGASFTPVELGAGDLAARRVVFRFDDAAPDPATVCTSPIATTVLPSSPPRLMGVFCDGARPVADVSGTATGPDLASANELVTTVTERLFPGGGAGGYSRGIPGVSVGVGVGSGGWGNSGWGLGGGLFF